MICHRRLRYPSNYDIMRAIRIAVGLCESPIDFPEYVRKILQEWGFSTRLVSDRRIWRLYEEMVRRGFISDTLGVILR